MIKTLTKTSVMLLCAATLCASATAAPAKPAKMVTLYKADKCGMYYTPALAKADHYACPDSKGKMSKVMLTPAQAKKVKITAK